MDRRRFFVAATAAAALAPRLVRAQTDSAEFSEYFGRMLTISEMNSWFFNEMTRHTESFDASLLLDENWRIDVLAPFAIPKASQDVLRDIDPPPLFQETHDHFLESVAYLVEAEPYMRHGVVNLDADSLASATELIELAGEAITRATEALPLT